MYFNHHYTNLLLSATQAKSIVRVEVVQNLWSGYGKIYRVVLQGSTHESVVVKHVHFPDQINHPRGWISDLSHHRKLKSYQIEMEWYHQYAAKCDESCRVPHCLTMETSNDEVFLVLEDLNVNGFPVRKSSINWMQINACLKWLACFHATFLNNKPDGLWNIGTYWHLDTRPDELNVLDDIALKNAAVAIDRKLNEARFKTLVHGDAKLANFCFSKDGEQVAAVDFQYVGGGCGMKDVAYFVGSCMYEDDCERYEAQVLDTYFASLKSALEKKNQNLDFNALETEWRELYPVAWTDFHRFLKGWSPGHWKINSYSERLSREVISGLK